MARRKRETSTDEAQIALIDVEHPMSKPFKALRRKMDKNDDASAALREEQKENRNAMIELFKEHNIQADADGVRKIEIDGEIIEIAPGESKIHFKSKPKPPKDETAAEDDKKSA